MTAIIGQKQEKTCPFLGNVAVPQQRMVMGVQGVELQVNFLPCQTKGCQFWNEKESICLFSKLLNKFASEEVMGG